MVERRANIVARLKSLEDGVAPSIAFLRNVGAVQELKSDNHYNLQWLNDKYQIDPTANPKLCNYRLQRQVSSRDYHSLAPNATKSLLKSNQTTQQSIPKN